MTWFAGFKNKKDILKCIRRIPVFMHIYYLVLSGSIFLYVATQIYYYG